MGYCSRGKEIEVSRVLRLEGIHGSIVASRNLNSAVANNVE